MRMERRVGRVLQNRRTEPPPSVLIRQARPSTSMRRVEKVARGTPEATTSLVPQMFKLRAVNALLAYCMV